MPAGSDAETTWQFNTSLGVPWGQQVCEDNRTLSLAVPPSAFNSSYTCVARNPIEERSASIHLGTLCWQQGNTPPPAPGPTPARGSWHPPPLVPAEMRGSQRWHMCYMLLAVGAGALLGLVCLWRKKRRKKAAKGGGCCRVKAVSSQPGSLGKRSWEKGNWLALPARPCPAWSRAAPSPPFPAPRLPPAPLGSPPPAPLSPATLVSPSREDAPLEPAYAEIQRTSPEVDNWVRLKVRGQIGLLAHCTVMPGLNSAPAWAGLCLPALPSRRCG